MILYTESGAIHQCRRGRSIVGAQLSLIGTLAVYTQLCAYYGKDAIVPIYIEVEDGLRLQRALDRERMQDKPKYTELCRRFLADDADFAEEALEKAGITRHFENDNLQKTVEEIAAFVLSYNG